MIQSLISHTSSSTVHQDTGGQSGPSVELDGPEISSQATHAPGEETADRRGEVTGHRHSGRLPPSPGRLPGGSFWESWPGFLLSEQPVSQQGSISTAQLGK